MGKHRAGVERPEKLISITLVPDGSDHFHVRATRRGRGYTYANNPIGNVERRPDGGWAHSGPSSSGRAIYGNAKSKELAARACYKAHASWVGY